VKRSPRNARNASLFYADTSAIVRVYLADEDDHASLQQQLTGSSHPVITSEIARVELAGAVQAASRAGRLRRPRVVLDRFDGDCAPGQAFSLIRLRPSAVFPLARDLLLRHALRTLDAMHLAVLLTDGAELAAGAPLSLVTRDARQASAAQALGIDVTT
jgi:predicted nucleic acid-binding protein